MTTDGSSLELQRLRILGSIDLENPDLRRQLDAVTERTARRLGQPISLVSLVLDTAQFFAGAHGVDGWLGEVRGTPIEWAFCARTVATGQPYLVPDATVDARQATNPLVTCDGIRSYAGVPVVIDGAVLGAHCVMGLASQTFTDADLAELRATAEEISALLQSYRVTDPPID